MSLYGALNAGTSSLLANASAMGALSDNITNTNTVGYKSTGVQFKTLVTKQSSSTQYSAGGVLAKPYQSVSEQGLMSSTSSNTDLAIDGDGMFVVASSAHQQIGDGYSYTRAGAMHVDKEGYLRNTAGSYLMGWPLMNDDGSPQAATIEVNGSSYMKAFKNDEGKTQYVNDSVIDRQNLKPLNTANLAGNATATTHIDWNGFTLPANGGTSFNYAPQVVDTLGAEHTILTHFYKTGPNQWEQEQTPPMGAATLTTSPNTGDEIYGSMGRVDFDKLPADGSIMNVNINGKTISVHFGDFGPHENSKGQKVNNPEDGKVTASSANIDVNIDVVGVQSVSKVVDSLSQALNHIFEYGPNNRKTIGNPGYGMTDTDLAVLNNQRLTDGKAPVTKLEETIDDPDYAGINDYGLSWGVQRAGQVGLNPSKWVGTSTEDGVQSLVIQQNSGDDITIDLSHVVAAPGGVNKGAGASPNTDPALANAQADSDSTFKAKTLADGEKIQADADLKKATLALTQATTNLQRYIKLQTQAGNELKTATDSNTKLQAAYTTLSGLKAKLGTKGVPASGTGTSAVAAVPATGDYLTLEVAETALTTAQSAVAKGATPTPAQQTAIDTAMKTRDKIKNTVSDEERQVKTLPADLANAKVAADDAKAAMNKATAAKAKADSDVGTPAATGKVATGAYATLGTPAGGPGVSATGAYKAKDDALTNQKVKQAAASTADHKYALAAGKLAGIPKFILNQDHTAIEAKLIPITEGGKSATLQGGQLDTSQSPSGKVTSFTIKGLSSKYLVQKSLTTGQIAKDIGMRNRDIPGLEFDNAGHPIRFFGYDKSGQPDPTIRTKIDWANGSEDMGFGKQAEITQKMGNYGSGDGIAQQGTEYNAGSTPQNGASFGFMTGINVGVDGTVTATYSNGTTRPIFQIPLATFVNENQMEGKSGNTWVETDESGRPTLRTAATARAGGIQGNALESSTADIAQEFTKMIKVQRAYSASTKIVTTTDQMLQELVSIKR